MKNKLEESIAVIRSLPQDKNFIKILNTLADRAEKDLNAWEAHEKSEIKLMTKNISHGYRQLLIRLASLRFVIKALNSKGDEVANYKCDLVGVLYVPKVPTINIPSSWEHGITFPKGTNHTIRIVVVAVKNIASLLT
ncbi:unnamed protein product [Rhizophagus irregularis]|nr:unnamed protein product [Rhizophagus irregularis]